MYRRMAIVHRLEAETYAAQLELQSLSRKVTDRQRLKLRRLEAMASSTEAIAARVATEVAGTAA